MIVLSVEGPAFIDRDAWSTHKILGVFATREEALASEVLDEPGLDAEEAVVLITDTETKDVRRVSFGDEEGEEESEDEDWELDEDGQAS